ncbi:two-component system response regulator [Pedobacter sp. SYSU D00535]|uniref:response regulator n=1 Tax=Pedobacter sp. SYSU D00535 TaxID=2810308 RepID=UPI001A965136|nr:response regulator [Pedobacter sp. SYSU D00535]
MKKRILVIDDDQGILEAVGEILDFAGFDVAKLPNCEQMFETIAVFKPDLVLIDYLLSDINGGEFCHLIKSNETTAAIPVIMMSAYPKVFLSLGNYNCDLFIAKPFDLDDLILKVNTCLAGALQRAV